MKKKLFFIFPLFALFITGCGFGGTRVINYNSDSHEQINPLQPDEGEGYKMVKEFAFNLQDVKTTTNQHCLPSKGDQYLLVVPVQFKNGERWTTSKLDVIRKGFFGQAVDTSWQSVGSFYNASSYGNLTIRGEVANTLAIDVTVEEASTHIINDQPSPDDIAISYFNASSAYNNLRKQYDKNEDGFIDSVVFIYSNAINSEAGYWAWVYWNSERASAEKPVINSYLWMSYYFFTDSDYAGYGSGIDAHTAIHETGHLLGLDDYYQYDKDNKYDPSGAIEMHSYNIGDDNIYSKFALGWVNPYFVSTTGSVNLSLRTSAYYGDAIILNDTWNGNSMDEYIMIEYYSPYGMNMMDSQNIYKPNGKKANRMYTVSGFRIYHIDSRIIEMETRGSFKQYVDTIGQGYYAVGASNSPSRSRLPGKDAIDFKYVHLLESSGVNTFKSGGIATNETLFKNGSSFVASAEFFPNGSKFNDGTEVGYRISVNECNDEFGSLTISKL